MAITAKVRTAECVSVGDARQYRVVLEYRNGAGAVVHEETVNVDCAGYPTEAELKTHLGEVATATIATLTDYDAVATAIVGQEVVSA